MHRELTNYGLYGIGLQTLSDYGTEIRVDWLVRSSVIPLNHRADGCNLAMWARRCDLMLAMYMLVRPAGVGNVCAPTVPSGDAFPMKRVPTVKFLPDLLI